MNKDVPQWHAPKDATPRHQCPCCDYITLPERGQYVICRVCFWEDDGLDLAELDEPSGANGGITLRQGRVNVVECGACEEWVLPNVVGPEVRDEYERWPRFVE